MSTHFSDFSITATPDLEDDRRDIHYVAAPCQVACPVGTDAPSYIGYIWQGKNAEALQAIMATNPFSSICGRVCDAPCEIACRRADSDAAIGIRNLKRYVLDSLGEGYALPAVKVSQSKSAAIVGAGPAGLTAAHDLAEAGYTVHVYEASNKLGGMTFWGIPRFRLPEAVIQNDIERIIGHCPGIKIHLNSALGDQFTLDQLKQKHDAVLLAIGAGSGNKMGISGESEPFVEDGVSFLNRINAGERPTLPDTVVIIGGGDVAMDACRAAIRLSGVKSVKVLYRRDAEGMPARKEELQGAIDEGVEIVYNTQPIAVVDDNILRCIRTEMGDPEEDGRRRPVNVAGSEFDVECGLVIAAVGQKAECSALEQDGLMSLGRVKTNFEGMVTEDPMVFGAGDGAFGGSTIIEAVHHGHRAAYYMKAFLLGDKNPLPYRTPYRTRRVPVCNDPDWEINPRVQQKFHGLGEKSIQFTEIESPYSAAEAKCEAARCFRCDAETGSSDFTVSSRESIFAMARVQPSATQEQLRILNLRLLNRQNPFTSEHVPTLDDLVFLPANLSRLVIDPYREVCKTMTNMGSIKSLKLDIPFTITGLDDAPDAVRKSFAKAIVRHGAAYIGVKPISSTAKWIQIVEKQADAKADAILYWAEDVIATGNVIRAVDNQPAGLLVNSTNLETAIPFALQHKLDFLLLDATNGLPNLAEELSGAPDIRALNQAVTQLRQLNREEEIDIVYFGGLRTGTDGAKILALGAKAVVLGVSAALSLGADVSTGEAVFSANLTSQELDERSSNLLQAFNAESSMMARCTGKTNIQNMEPEDLRALTIAASHATGVPMAGSLNQH